MGSGFVSVRAEGRVTGTDSQRFVLGGSSFLQGRDADEAQFARHKRREKEVGCSERPHP